MFGFSREERQAIMRKKVFPSKEKDQEFLSKKYLRLSNETYTKPSDKEVIVMKGLLWVQQDKLFSRWKERFIVLTSHYLQFFKKTSSRISEMGAFIMKVGTRH